MNDKRGGKQKSKHISKKKWKKDHVHGLYPLLCVQKEKT
jgi:hypothetical protein